MNIYCTLYLLSKVRPLECYHTHIHSVCNKRLVVHKLIRGECGDGIQKELCCLLEITDGHTVKTLIHLQAIPSVPISAFLDQTESNVRNCKLTHCSCVRLYKNVCWTIFLYIPFGFLSVPGDEVIVHVKQANPQQVKDNIQAMSKGNGLVISLPEGSQGSFLIDSEILNVRNTDRIKA